MKLGKVDIEINEFDSAHRSAVYVKVASEQAATEQEDAVKV